MLTPCPLPRLPLDAVVGELFWYNHAGAAYPRGNYPIHCALVFAPLPGAVVGLPVASLVGLWRSDFLIAAVRLQNSSYNVTLCVLPSATLHKNVLRAHYKE